MFPSNQSRSSKRAKRFVLPHYVVLVFLREKKINAYFLGIIATEWYSHVRVCAVVVVVALNLTL